MLFYETAEEILNNTTSEVLGNFSILITVLQALGGVIAVYIIFNIIMVVINRKRNKKILGIMNEVGSMNKSIDSIDKNLKEIKNLLSKKKNS